MTSLTSWLSDDNWTGSKNEGGHSWIKSHPQGKRTQIKDWNDIYHNYNHQKEISDVVKHTWARRFELKRNRSQMA